MIKFKLNILLEGKEMSQRKLSELTGIRPGTINLYYHGFVKRINMDDLDKMCSVLDCDIGDLIEYVPNIKNSPG